VDDAAAVGERNRVTDLQEDLQEIAEALGRKTRRAGGVERFFERLALYEPHREKMGPALIGTELVNRNDVGMLEVPRNMGLLDEAHRLRAVRRAVRAQHLDGDITSERLVVGADHEAHSSAADHLAFHEMIALGERGAPRSRRARELHAYFGSRGYVARVRAGGARRCGDGGVG
jgi:hypothetical protein